MPFYDFLCSCEESKGKPFEEMCSYEDISSIVCPHCKSKEHVQKLLSKFCLTFANPKESSKSDNFEYMAQHNLENAKGVRRNAEEKSHMGATPYSNINDLEKFGEGMFHKGDDY